MYGPYPFRPLLIFILGFVHAQFHGVDASSLAI